MLSRLGMKEGDAIEHRWITKSVERAQRKVEERNFSTRKHLLEWDEPMDYQRKEFYTARQRILEERDLPGLILETMERTIDNTVGEYLGGGFARQSIAEWCRGNLDVNLNEDDIDTEDIGTAKASIRSHAVDEAEEAIRTSLGEYIDPEEPPQRWDIGGLLHWAQRMFKINHTQNQLRKMDPQEIEDTLCEAARGHFKAVDLEPIMTFLDPQYPARALSELARAKFNVDVPLDDLIDRPKEEVVDLMRDRVREAYRQREIAYPVEWCVERAFAVQDPSKDPACSPVAAAMIAEWVNAKYNLNWEPDRLQGRSRGQIYHSLLELSRNYFNGDLEKEVDRNTAGKHRDASVAWAKERFKWAWSDERFEHALAAGNGDPGAELRAALLAQGREMLRWELTRLEQFVLLRIYDQAWKDHLLEMDHLKTAIMQRPLGGDQTHPQSQYAIEGRDLFTQMWSRIARRVTDLIFKIQAAPTADDEAGEPAGPSLVAQHADATGAGFSAMTRDQAAAMRAQNVEAKVETIRRDQPKVGRNDPCPCGSGKKYKQCHGKGQ
jgi:preprotein translocase subunit SecA